MNATQQKDTMRAKNKIEVKTYHPKIMRFAHEGQQYHNVNNPLLEIIRTSGQPDVYSISSSDLEFEHFWKILAKDRIVYFDLGDKNSALSVDCKVLSWGQKDCEIPIYQVNLEKLDFKNVIRPIRIKTGTPAIGMNPNKTFCMICNRPIQS